MQQELFSQTSDLILAGCDEVGRGPLAGDVVAAAVILPVDHGISGINDSKKLTEKKRELLFDQITTRAVAYAIARCTPSEIDQLNILHASMEAMKRAVESLSVQPEKVMVDGNRLPVWQYHAEAVVGGDAKYECIAAASILAKVTRDREMKALAERYPHYGFEKHKGYPTKAHLQAISDHGVSPIHRRSFAPVRRKIDEFS